MASTITNELIAIRSNFSLGLTAWALLRRLPPEAYEQFDVLIAEQTNKPYRVRPGMKPSEVSTGDFLKVVWLDAGKGFSPTSAVDSFVRMVARQFATDMFEAIRDFCEENNQLSALRQQPWYHFARFVRNAFKHDLNLKFRNSDKNKVLPVTWHGKTIEASMDGEKVPVSFFGYYECACFGKRCVTSPRQ